MELEKILEIYDNSINNTEYDNEDVLSVENSLTNTFIEMQQFFIALGYHVSGDFPNLCFKLMYSMKPEILGNIKAFEELGKYIKPLMVKKKSESDAFLKDYYRFLNIKQTKTSSSNKQKNKNVNHLYGNKAYAENQLEELNKKEKTQKNALHSLEEKLNNQKPGCISQKTADKMEQSIKEIEKAYKNAFGKSKMYNQLRNLHYIALGNGELTKKQLDNIKKELKKGLLNAKKDKDFIKLMKVISEQEKLSAKIKTSSPEKIKSKIEEKKKNIKEIQNQKEDIQNQLDKIFEDIDKAVKQINKQGKPVHHRTEFLKYNVHNAVLSDFEGIPFLEKEFDFLTEREKEDIRDFILENARKFRTRISRNIRTSHNDKLDMAETVKKACSTNGIPINLQYERPKKQKARLLMLLDVSGSCRDASEMMLTFMYQMKEIFPGGCKSYAFVNSLYDISAMFDSPDEKTAIKKVLDTIPRRGVYSDYGVPIKDFYTNHMADITKDTLIFWIGDARNNNRAAYPDYFKAMSRKAKKTFWLNTESRNKWNVNDSIIDTYKPYCDLVIPTTTTRQLLEFLVDVK